MERNTVLDYFKLILSLLVITIHLTNQPSNIFLCLISEGVARVAVPCFFIINGYFVDQLINDTKKLKKYIFTLLMIYLVWSFIYSPFFYGNFFNEIFNGFFHLWYLLALIGAILILFCLKKNKLKTNLILSFSLFFSGFIFQLFFISGDKILDPSKILFKILFIAFPFVFIGYYLKIKTIKISLKKSLILTSIFFILLLFESLISRYLTLKYQLGGLIDNYMSLIILCPLLVCVFFKINIQSDQGNLVSKIASGVYFIHILVIHLIRQIFGRSDVFYLYPIITIISLIFSAGLLVLNKRLKIFL